ncbi:MAG: hypothetical protein HZB40_07870 [Rhodocyclales bacterium]|nr:hypothetical protein [Rhodocyclales bacterium]
MSLLVALTGLAGLFASFLMLHAGVDAMGVRYPLATGAAYGVFLILLWLWLRTRAEDWVDGSLDVPDFSSGSSGGSGGAAPVEGIEMPVPSPGGGNFGGGGASSSFQFDDNLPAPSLPDVGGDGVGKLGEAVGEVVGGADEGAIPLALILLVAALAAVLLLASLYVIYLAPALFAELLVDGALSASLYRRMRGLQTRHWLESALRRTALPFLLTAIGLGLVGHGLNALAPEAHSVGEAVRVLGAG